MLTQVQYSAVNNNCFHGSSIGGSGQSKNGAFVIKTDVDGVDIILVIISFPITIHSSHHYNKNEKVSFHFWNEFKM